MSNKPPLIGLSNCLEHSNENKPPLRFNARSNMENKPPVKTKEQ